MKNLTFFIFLIVFFSCNSKVNNAESQNNEVKSNKNDTPIYSFLKHNLYIDNFGNLGFKTIDQTDPLKPKDKFINIVWNANPMDSSNNGKMPMKSIVDTASFKEIKGVYFQDKNNIYVFNKMADGGTFSVLNDIDQKTFNVLSLFYAKDINFVYHGSKKIEGADVKTFEPLPKVSVEGDTLWQYGKDKKHYYYFGNIIKPEEFDFHKLKNW